jgi:oligopeptidase A
MDGVPEDVFEATCKAAAADGRDGCKLNLQQATYGAVMRFATNRPLREKLYHAYVTRASDIRRGWMLNCWDWMWKRS